METQISAAWLDLAQLRLVVVGFSMPFQLQGNWFGMPLNVTDPQLGYTNTVKWVERV